MRTTYCWRYLWRFRRSSDRKHWKFVNCKILGSGSWSGFGNAGSVSDPDQHQNLIDSSLGCVPPRHKISRKTVHNFWRYFIHKNDYTVRDTHICISLPDNNNAAYTTTVHQRHGQTDRRTDGRTTFDCNTARFALRASRVKNHSSVFIRKNVINYTRLHIEWPCFMACFAAYLLPLILLSRFNCDN